MTTIQAVRKPVFAGPYSFYSNDRKKLSVEIQNYLNNVKPLELPQKPFALISPHAGYLYSGQTAAYAFKQIANIQYDRVVVIAPSHRQSFNGASVFPGKAYETPLGEIAVDTDFCKELLNYEEVFSYNSIAEENEHSLEVQLPFLQKVQKSFKLVPILISDQMYNNCENIAESLFTSLQQIPAETIFVASTDLYHGPSSDKCNKADEKLIDILKKADAAEFNRKASKREIMACGYGPVTTILLLAEKFNRKNIEILYHTNSVESADGPEDYVVGYLAACIY